MQDPAAAALNYEQVADHMVDVVLRVDLDGVLQYVSPSVRAYGHEPQALIGGTPADIAHPDDLARVWTNTHAALAGAPLPPAAERQNRYRTAAGGWVWMEGNPRAVTDADGKIVGMVNVLRDVTEQRTKTDLFEAAFEHAAVGKALVGLDGGFLRVNPAFCRITGYPQERMRALNFQTITHPDDLNADLDQLDQLAAGQITNYRMDKRYIRADGELIWVHLTVSMVRQADGSPNCYVAQVQDLSERRAAEAALKESEARHRLILENTSDIIVMADLSGTITYISASTNLMGHDMGGLKGGSFVDQAHPDDAKSVKRVFRRLLKGALSQRVRWRARHPRTGAWVWLESSPNLLRDPLTGAPTGFLDVIRDVGRQVEQEAALAEARARAEDAASAKTQFLANMSHEIRTPLTAVLGFTALLAEASELSPVSAGYVKRIAGAGSALLALVNDILDFSKLEAGKFEIRPRATDLEEVCRESLMLFSNQAEAKGVALSFEALGALPPAVSIDPDRLRQMVLNLVGNAVKFTEAGEVRLTVCSRGETCRIEVSDTGPGLDAEAQARLFQRFTQVDGSMTRRHGGTGLGLAICRGIVEAMGGDIGVTSAPGEGATFHLVLPAPPTAAPQAVAGAAIGSIEGARIFVVDDNPVNRELARRVLEAAGAEVTDAASGEEGVRQLALLPVDLVLMDLRMPGLDGRGALARLRIEDGPNQDVPVLAFTADADVAVGGDLGQFDGLVRKPIEPLAMYAAIAEAICGTAPRTEDTHVAA